MRRPFNPAAPNGCGTATKRMKRKAKTSRESEKALTRNQDKGFFFLPLAQFFPDYFFQGRLADLLQLIADPDRRFVDLDQTPEIDGSTNHNGIGIRLFYCLLQFLNLFFAVTHGRKDIGEMAVFGESINNTTDSIGAGINKFGGAKFAGGNGAGPVFHVAV